MDAYDPFAPFYDALMGDPGPRLAVIRQVIERHCPSARSVLELGCGTGSILEGLATVIPDRTGVDRSTEMLRIARQRAAGAELIEADMASYRGRRRFDVVLCVYDSLNHLTSFEDWGAVFDRTAEHLEGGGVFHFDVNTVGRLRRLAGGPAWVHDFDGHTLTMDVELGPAPARTHLRTTWRIRVFEHERDRTFILHETTVPELGVPLDELRARLGRCMRVLECADGDGAAATDDSDRAYLTCALRGT